VAAGVEPPLGQDLEEVGRYRVVGLEEAGRAVEVGLLAEAVTGQELGRGRAADVGGADPRARRLSMGRVSLPSRLIVTVFM
jgi:hypothetical protein